MRNYIPLIAVVLCGLLSQPVQADRHRGGGLQLESPYLAPDRGNRDARQSEPRRSMTPGEAAQRAQQVNGGGRVLSVEPAGDGYRVKLLRDGEVRVVVVR